MRFFSAFILVLIAILSTAQPANHAALEPINSPYDELNPVVSTDGRTLYMTIANHPANVGGKKDPGDIWFAVLNESNAWSAPVHGGALLNSRGYNGVAGMSADGNALFLLSHYDASGTPRTQGIAVSRKAGAAWSAPENISIPYFQNKSNALTGTVTADGAVFVYAAETYGTRGVEDIYISLRGGDGRWSEPKNLGSVINTPFQELSPSLSSDGRTLYFSSNGRKGFGSFDVYQSTRLDDGWTNWSEPVNMGPAINTEGRDLFYRPYAALRYALFTSTTNSDGYGDIKMLRSDEPFPTPPDSVTFTASTKPALDTVAVAAEPPARSETVKVYGRVTDSKTGEPVPASITFTARATLRTLGAKASPASGYTVDVLPPDHYDVAIEAGGYVSTLEKLDIQTTEMPAVEMNFRLQPVEIGTTVNLRNVLFEQGKTQLLTGSYPELDMVVSFLKTNPKVKIELAGHTDNRGVPGQNVKLSQARVDKVRDYLVEKGIDRKRITGKGFGGSRPIASNDSEETRQLNRRVEFTIRKF